MKRTTAAPALVAALMITGCTTQTDEAREYAESACTNYTDGSVGLSVDYTPVASLTALRKLIDDEVTPGLASAAKRDDRFSSTHTSATNLSASLALVITAIGDESAPDRQALAERAIGDFTAFEAECDVILAD